MKFEQASGVHRIRSTKRIDLLYSIVTGATAFLHAFGVDQPSGHAMQQEGITASNKWQDATIVLSNRSRLYVLGSEYTAGSPSAWER